LADLVDPGSFTEYGQLAVAAQRNRRDYEDLQVNTAADGIITGIATINRDTVPEEAAQTAVMICDYSVLAGTQGYFHHHKLDRLCELAAQMKLPVIIYTEGGGGRPGDTDIATGVSGLDVESFLSWGRLSGQVPRIAVNNGYCFAGNAALFGCADITIATRTSWIGMAGPAMIEGGGLGKCAPTDIGPMEVQEKNGVVDIVVQDEAEATTAARKLLGYFQGSVNHWESSDQTFLRDALPEDRRYGYNVRRIIECIADQDSFTELRRVYGRSVITGFIRIEGKPLGLICSDCQQMGGAIDSVASEKAARFLQLCDAFDLPVLSLTDTPGYMVGKDSEAQGAVRKISRLLVAGASITVPMVNIILRKAYGLGAIAMAGGSFVKPVYTAAWPTGEFGAMGLEGAVTLGYRKELDAVSDPAEREALFNRLLQRLYELGKATESAAALEIDAVIDPADTRKVIMQALNAATSLHRNKPRRRNMVDTW
ncbi:MAG: carboxyl transferase domain-containing protein, partial [Ketobacteraceae bacterium]|nr:carboxyl transferase domain-containing protein [Ketobacteraceae bacterium]